MTTHIFSAFTIIRANYLCWLELRLSGSRENTWRRGGRPLSLGKVLIHFLRFDKELTNWEGWKGELGFCLSLHEAPYNMDGGCLRPETWIDRLPVHWSPCQTPFFDTDKSIWMWSIKLRLCCPLQPQKRSFHLFISINEWVVYDQLILALVVCVTTCVFYPQRVRILSETTKATTLHPTAVRWLQLS